MTPKERDEILLSLKKLVKGQKELFKMQEERDEILLDLKKGQEELKEEVGKLSKTVAKIEIEHGQKLEMLFDAVTMHSEKFDSTENRLNSHEDRLNKQDDKIFHLNSKVQAF